ncbi:MAG: hypothetical protein NT029_09320 [Armatimonadetes bacterium]|nr:hypothetical protein [Armatimonadota bacterium]
MSLRAVKHPEILIQPLVSGPTSGWEGHHATNPCCVRLSLDPRVFLGYRAGGTADYFRVDVHDVWASHLGLAVLDARGEQVTHRLPLPIFAIERSVWLPQTQEEFEAYQQGPHRDEILVLHDFRFWEDGPWLYMIYHEGSVTQVFDCIVRMPAADFLARVARSIELAASPVEEIMDEWRALWWAPGVWEPAGVGGTNRIYSSWANKNDIVFIRLTDGSLRMLHRPVPDVAVVDTRGRTHCPSNAAGVADFGVVQSSIRPGYFDNSHIGNNGTPIRACVGSQPLFVDVVHGVRNRTLCEADGSGWRLFYLPYLRLLDADTGECLYWSSEPLLEADETWRGFVEEGEWVSTLVHLDGVMFAGGQVEADAGKIGPDDLFHFYTGVGDTAVARASFRLRDVAPSQVLADIETRRTRRSIRLECEPSPTVALPEPLCGWEWAIEGDGPARELAIVRRLGEREVRRPVTGRPGFFDADGVFFDGQAPERVECLGWLLPYRGVRWENGPAGPITVSGLGVMALDLECPERILYRSEEPIGAVAETAGWSSGGALDDAARPSALHIPTHVRAEMRRIYERRPMGQDMARHLRIESGLEDAP